MEKYTLAVWMDTGNTIPRLYTLHVYDSVDDFHCVLLTSEHEVVKVWESDSHTLAKETARRTAELNFRSRITIQSDWRE